VIGLITDLDRCRCGAHGLIADTERADLVYCNTCGFAGSQDGMVWRWQPSSWEARQDLLHLAKLRTRREATIRRWEWEHARTRRLRGKGAYPEMREGLMYAGGSRMRGALEDWVHPYDVARVRRMQRRDGLTRFQKV